MAKFTTTKQTLDEIAERTTQNEKRVAQARALLGAAQADLAAMSTSYQGFASELNADAAANPSDPAWQNAKAEKDQMLTDFQALKGDVDALIVAYDAV